MKLIKKADIVLAVFLIVCGLAASFWISAGGTDVHDGRVVVHVNEKYYGSWPLDEDREILIERDGHTNKITIKDGYAQMTFSDCHNQDCVKQGRIHDRSKSIICLPNKVVVEVISGESEYKVIAG